MKADFKELVDSAPQNLAIIDAWGKCRLHVNTHQKIMASISGGSDSDVMMDMIIRCGGKEKTTFVFFNTGLEYEATKKQIQFLNEKYGVEIQVVPPIKPSPLCVREFGIPFWSKQVSDMIERLQKHNFQWEDEPLDVLLQKYPKCKSALRWWCNDWGREKGKVSNFDIAYVRYLKEFLIAHPPTFRISNGDIVESENGLETTGCNRTGCMFCMFGCTQDGTPNRFQRMKETHPRQYDYCMRPLDQKGLGLKEVLEYIGVPYE